MILPLFFFLLTTFLCGFLVSRVIWNDPISGRLQIHVHSARAFALGFGVSSILWFFWFLARGPADQFWIPNLAFVLLLGVFHFRSKKNSEDSFAGFANTTANTKSPAARVVAVIIWPLLFAAILIFASYSVSSPHGQWDAWATWNLRARYFFFLGENWKNSFTSLIPSTNADYPLLLPITIVQGWHLLGADSQIVPVVVAFLITFGAIAILYTSTELFRGRLQAQIALLVLVSTYLFIERGASQQADVAVSGYCLLTTVFLVSAAAWPKSQVKSMILAGLSASCAAWTKNEGSVLLLSVVLMVFWTHFRTKGSHFFRPLLFLILGALPGFLALIVFKSYLSPPGYVLAQGYDPILSGLTDPERFLYILREFGVRVILFGGGNVPIPPLLVLYALLVGMRGKPERKHMECAVFTLLLTLAGYMAFYQITPFDYKWQISQSMDRLLMQWWPSLLFLFFYVVKSPGDAILGEPDESRQRIAHTEA